MPEPIPCPKCGRLYTWTGTRCCNPECRFGSGKEPKDPTPRLEWEAYREAESEANLLGICRVHKVPLLKGEAPMWYGLVRLSQEYSSDKIKQFPNSRSFVLGGSFVSSTNPKTMNVDY